MQVDLLTLLEGDDGLLPVAGATGGLRGLTAGLARDVLGINPEHLHLEELFHGTLDRRSARAPISNDRVLVELLGLKGALLGDPDGLDDVEGSHGSEGWGFQSASRASTLANASLVKTNLSYRSNS